LHPSLYAASKSADQGNEVGAGNESCKKDGSLILLQLAVAAKLQLPARPASLGSGGNYRKYGWWENEAISTR